MVKLYMSRGGHQLFSIRSEFERWNDLPYGIWTTSGARTILFNRFYEPLSERNVDGSMMIADPHEWVKEINSQRWFYKDGPSESAKRKAAIAALAIWNDGRIP